MDRMQIFDVLIMVTLRDFMRLERNYPISSSLIKKYFDLIPFFGHKVYDKWQKGKEGYIWLNYK